MIPVDKSPFEQVAEVLADGLDRIDPARREYMTNYELAEELAGYLIERGIRVGG